MANAALPIAAANTSSHGIERFSLASGVSVCTLMIVSFELSASPAGSTGFGIAVSMLGIAAATSPPVSGLLFAAGAFTVPLAAGAPPAMALISSGDIMLISSITIALAMVTLLVAHALENVRRTARHKAEIEAIKLAELTAAQVQTAKPQEEPEAKAPADKSTPEKRLAAFSEQYSLTPRERDVLSAVCSSEETLQCIADDMGISLRALQKHLTSIYRKSDTQSRAGLCSAALTEPLEH